MVAHSMSEADGIPAAVQRRLPHPLAVAWFALFAGLLLAILFAAFFGKASDGEPVVLLDLAPPAVHHAAAKKPSAKNVALPAAPPQLGQEAVPPGAVPQAGAEQNAPAPSSVPATMPPDAALPPGTAKVAEPQLPPQIVPKKIVSPVYAGKALVADPALIEATPDGPLPRIADDGRTPMMAYAPPFQAGKRLRIALVIGGLGISARATQAALDGLPPAVTLAFAPYAGDAQRWVGEARRRGHEVLLEVPMEPYDFPDSDPGPHTLRPTLGENGNIQRLTWSLSRFTGYSGITNLLGGRFLANGQALEPVMTYLARRGLLFYDSGSNGRSAAAGVAQETGTPYVQSAVTVDSIQSGMEIDQRLSELETRARAAGAAAGTGFLYPVTIERVAQWAKGLDGRGFVLVPASAIVAKAK